MTLNGVIALTSPNCGVMSPNSVTFWTDYVKVVEDTLILSAVTLHVVSEQMMVYSMTLENVIDVFCVLNKRADQALIPAGHRTVAPCH